MAKYPVSFTVNGDEQDLLIEPRKTLLAVLTGCNWFDRYERKDVALETVARVQLLLTVKL